MEIVDEDNANLLLRETLSQIAFLVDEGTLNSSQAFEVFFDQPIAQALLYRDIQEHLPEGCVLQDYDDGSCYEEDEETTKVMEGYDYKYKYW